MECDQTDDAYIGETGFGALLKPEEEGRKNELIIKLSKLNEKKTRNDNESIGKEKDDGNETPSIKQDSLSKDHEEWSPTAISSLLDAWCQYNKNPVETKKSDMDCMWKQICEEVSARCRNLKKPKDPEQCKVKVKSMQGRYNREKMAKKFNPNECSSWEWYDIMDTFHIENPQIVANLTDGQNATQGASTRNIVLSSRTLYDISEKHIGKCVIGQNSSKESPSIDAIENFLHANNKNQHIHKEETFESKFCKDESNVQYTNLLTPTTPKSPRSLNKVKWKDSTLSQLSHLDKFKEENNCQDNCLDTKPLRSCDGKESFLLSETIESTLNCEQGTSNNISMLDRKGKGTLKTFDLSFDNSTNCFRSDIIDQDSATSNPIVLKSSQSTCIPNEHDNIGSSDRDSEDRQIGRSRVMEISKSINCNSKHTCIETIKNTKRHGNVKKEDFKEPKLNIKELDSLTIEKPRAQDHSLATNIVRNDEHMAVSIARGDLEVQLTKPFSKGSSLASITSQSESSYCSKQKGRLRASSKYKCERGLQSSRTFITTLMRATNSMPQFKKRVRSLNPVPPRHEQHMVAALMTFGAMIQQLEKNHIVLMEKILNEQSNILKDFVNSSKYNHQVREATMVGLVVRFLLSIFLIGLILFGTSKTPSSWMPIGSQYSWYGKNIDDNFSQLAWIGCFVILLFTQTIWTSFKRRPTTPSQT